MNLALSQQEKDHHIMALVLTKGVPFYGYHVGHQTFLKIYLVNPARKQTMVDILMSGAFNLSNLPFQPHEAHINFELQFLMDFNLFGMDWIHLDEHVLYQFRLPLVNFPRSFNVKEAPLYTSQTVSSQHISSIPRESHCELELDVTCWAILNRLDVTERDIHTQLYEPNLAKDKLVTSLQVIWNDELQRRKARDISDPTIPPVSQTEPREPHVPWLAEPGLRKSMEKMMHHHVWEKDQSPLLDQIVTIFQAVEALHPDQKVVLSSSPERTTPLHSQQSEYNVSATPTRYRDWNISSQLDPDILQAFLQDPSFHQDDEEDNKDENQDDENEDDYFSQTDPLTDSALAQWIEAQEETYQYKPRQLNFEPPSTSIVEKKVVTKDIFDMEDMPFSISHLPPTSGPPGLNKKKRKRPIPQVDGPNDQSEPSKQLLTSAEKWDLQRQQLKMMRRRTKSTGYTPLQEPVSMTIKQQEDSKARVDFIKKRYRKLTERFGKNPSSVEKPVENNQQEVNEIPVIKMTEEEETVLQEEIHIVQEEPKIIHKEIIQEENSIDTLPSISSKESNSLQIPSYLLDEQASFSDFIEPISSPNQPHEFIYQPTPPEIHVPTTITYQEPFYSKPADAPTYPTVFSGKEFKLPTTNTLKEFKSTFHTILDKKIGLENTRIKQWTPALDPPSYDHVSQWKQKTLYSGRSQLDEPTRDNTFDFKLSATKPHIEIKVDNDFIDYLSLEIHGKFFINKSKNCIINSNFFFF